MLVSELGLVLIVLMLTTMLLMIPMVTRPLLPVRLVNQRGQNQRMYLIKVKANQIMTLYQVLNQIKTINLIRV